VTATAETPAEAQVTAIHPPGSSEIARREIIPSIPDKIRYAKALADAGLLPAAYRKQPANVLWAVEYGEMLGLPPVAVITGVHVIDNKPSASAGLISGLVRKAGHRLRVGYDEATWTGWATIVRADDPGHTFRSEWNLDRAVTAELCTIRDGKPYAVDSKGKSLPWRRFYPSMTKARAITEVARDACEEVLFGLHYTPEELGASVDENGTVLPVNVPETEPDPEPEPARPREAIPPPDDRPWPDIAIERAATLKSEHAGTVLWQEAVAKKDAGEITQDDYDPIWALIGARVADLRKITFEQAMNLLSEDEPWRGKIDELASPEDADAALAELDTADLDRRRDQRIRRAIVALARLKGWRNGDQDEGGA
jgi:hypothetical protein